MDTRWCASEEAEPRRGVDTRRYASKDASPKGGRLGTPTSIGEGNKAFFVRVQNLSPRRCVLKNLRGRPKGKVQRGQYLLVVRLGPLHEYTTRILLDTDTKTC